MHRKWYKGVDLQNYYLANKSTVDKDKMLEGKTYVAYIADLETHLTALDEEIKQQEERQDGNRGKKYHS